MGFGKHLREIWGNLTYLYSMLHILYDIVNICKESYIGNMSTE